MQRLMPSDELCKQVKVLLCYLGILVLKVEAPVETILQFLHRSSVSCKLSCIFTRTIEKKILS